MSRSPKGPYLQGTAHATTHATAHGPGACSGHRYSIFCILPPDLLHRIATNGSPAQRAWALETLASDHGMRLMRRPTS